MHVKAIFTSFNVYYFIIHTENHHIGSLKKETKFSRARQRILFLICEY